jgi:hypothetical protein
MKCDDRPANHPHQHPHLSHHRSNSEEQNHQELAPNLEPEEPEEACWEKILFESEMIGCFDRTTLYENQDF